MTKRQKRQNVKITKSQNDKKQMTKSQNDETKKRQAKGLPGKIALNR